MACSHAGREQVKRDLLYRDFYTFLAQRKALQTAQQGAPTTATRAGKTSGLPGLPQLPPRLLPQPQPQLALA